MVKRDCNKETFVRITNEDIYKKLCAVEEHVIYTNGKVKFNTKMIAILATGLVLLAGWVFALAININ